MEDQFNDANERDIEKVEEKNIVMNRKWDVAVTRKLNGSHILRSKGGKYEIM